MQGKCTFFKKCEENQDPNPVLNILPRRSFRGAEVIARRPRVSWRNSFQNAGFSLQNATAANQTPITKPASTSVDIQPQKANRPTGFSDLVNRSSVKLGINIIPSAADIPVVTSNMKQQQNGLTLNVSTPQDDNSPNQEQKSRLKSSYKGAPAMLDNMLYSSTEQVSDSKAGDLSQFRVYHNGELLGGVFICF